MRRAIVRIADCRLRIVVCQSAIRRSGIGNAVTARPWLISCRPHRRRIDAAGRPRQRVAARRRSCESSRGASARSRPGQAHRERAALAQLAFQRDVAAQQPAQLADDRQPQPACPSTRGSSRRRRRARWRPGGISRRSAAGPPRDADARVGDGQPQVARVGRARAETWIRPPSGVNLIALDSRLLRICCDLALVLAQRRQAGGDLAVQVDVLLLGQRPGHVALRRARRRRCRTRSGRTSILPLSILARSRMSLIMSSSIRPDVWMLLHVALLLVVERAIDAASTSLKPRMLLSGVRSSWLIVARKSLFRLVHLEQPHVDLGQLVDLAVELAVDVPQLVLLARAGAAACG